MRLSVALRVSPIAGGYGGSHDGQMASQHDRAKRFHVLVDDEEGDERQHRPTVIVGQDQQVGLAAKLGVTSPSSTATSLAEQVYVHRVYPLWPMQGGSLRVIQAGSDDGASDLKLQIDGAR